MSSRNLKKKCQVSNILESDLNVMRHSPLHHSIFHAQCIFREQTIEKKVSVRLKVMECVIDIQGFVDARGAFVAKEITIVTLDDCRTTGHWIIARGGETIEQGGKKGTNFWVSRHHHGLPWLAGTSSESDACKGAPKPSSIAEKFTLEASVKSNIYDDNN